MRTAAKVMLGVLLLLVAGCDIPKALTRISYAQVGADGIAVSFFPRSNHDSGNSNDDDFFSTTFDVSGIVLPLVSLFF